MKLILLPAAALVFALAACANGDPAGDAAAPATATVSASALSTVAPSEEPSVPAPSEGATTTISGTISAGVEPNCILLDDHLLILKDEAHKSVARAGASVTVTGYSQSGMMTTCMQGTPFVVTSIRAN